MTPYIQSLIEKAVEAMRAELIDPSKDWGDIARAALLTTLEALGEPSERMLKAGYHHASFDDDVQPVWRAMLSQLRKEVEE